MALRGGIAHDESSCGPVVWLLLALILLGGIGLRLVSLRGSLWLDEMHTAWVVSGDFNEVASRAMLGNQPPLPYWLLWLYVQCVGLSELSLRLPSFVASSGAIILVFVAARRWLGSPIAGLAAAAALAVESNSALFYASEARVYAVVQFAALLQLLAFEAVMRTGSARQRMALLVMSWLLFYLHYTVALLFMAELLAWLLLWSRNRVNAYGARSMAIDASLLVLGCLPALSHLREIFERRQNWAAFVARPTWDDVIAIVPHHQMLNWITAAWALAMAVRWLGASGTSLRLPALPVATLIIAWLGAPLLIAWTLTQTDIARVFHLRYLVYVLPVGGMFLAMLVSTFPRQRTQWLCAVGVAAVLVGWHFNVSYSVLYGWEQVRNEDWRGAISHLNRLRWPAGKPLFLAAELVEADALPTSDDPALREYCLFPLHAAYPLNNSGAVEVPLPYHEPGRLSVEHQVLVQKWLDQNDGSAVFLVRGPKSFADEVAADVVRTLDGDVRLTQRHGFGDLWLFSVQKKLF